MPGTGIPNDGTPSDQLHDFEGGIAPSGLFWTVRIPNHAFRVSRDRRFAELHVKDLCLLDSFVFLGPNPIPAKVNAFVRWKAIGPAESRGKGDDVPPTDPAAFSGELSFAKAAGRFSGSELGFAFAAEGRSRSPAFAELGSERNGVLLQ